MSPWAAPKYDSYGLSDFVDLKRHSVLAGRLMRWIRWEQANPSEEPSGRVWFYAVPLTSLRTTDHLRRILITPLLRLATAPELNANLVEQVFRDVPEVLKY